MAKLARLQDFPKSVDAIEVAQPDWVCAPCGVCRDSSPLARSNFDALVDLLDNKDPYGSTWEILRFGHFGVGWIDEIFVQPDSECAKVAEEVRGRMAKYPCLDENLWAEYEMEDSGR